MRKFLAIIMLAVAAVAFAAEKATALFTLDHQMQQSCKTKITTNLRFEKGVQKIDVSLPDNTITIVYNPDKTNPDKLIAAFKKIGFNAFIIEPEEKESTPADSK